MRLSNSMPEMGRRSLAGLAALSLITGCWGLITSRCQATTLYHVRLKTEARVGQQAQVAFDFTSDHSAADSVEILNFSHDGKTAPIISVGTTTVEGGLVRGDLLLGSNPAARTIVGNDFFYNQLRVPFDSLGTSIDFDLRLPEPSVAPAGVPDEMALFYVADDRTPAFPTLDPLGTDALFAVCVTGASGGDLSVFAPMRFVPPDTLMMNNSTDDVTPGDLIAGRLQFHSIVPNPSSGGVRLVYAIPDPGGELRVKIFDVAGRLMAQPFAGKRTAGTWTTQWDAKDLKGRSVSTGVYLVQLQMGGQSLVRRAVLTR
jgi:hypothetical protein